ncbi:MAG: response regulator, partial [Acidobacteriota bacterium]
MRILVVEDEEVLAEAIVETLEDESYAVDYAADGALASELMAANTYDLVMLDWSIPPPSGMELLRQWRAEGKETPVLMLTANSEAEEVVAALDSGADDYVTKPFTFAVLLARARSLLRRREKPLVAVLAAADVEMHRPTRTVTVDGQQIDLP